MADFAKRLKQLRIEYDYNLNELATELKTTQATLSRYENNKSYPNSKQLLKMSKIFECSTDYLLAQSDEKIRSDQLFSLYHEAGLELEELLNKFQVIFDDKKLSNQEKANLVKFMGMMRDT